MRIARTLRALAQERALLDAAAPHVGTAASHRPHAIGFVPTMGALHDGHVALLQAAGAECSTIVASIFVNPTQFAPGEDFCCYPRDEASDLTRLRSAGCDLAWLPDAATMYSPDAATQVVPAGPALGWEGEQRPGHFAGVATVVAKLFGQIRPQRAYFGEKDWQQLQVIRRMVTDLHLPVEVVGVATRRDPDGLALSSRNRFLSLAERDQAPHLAATLRATAHRLATLAAVPTAGSEPGSTDQAAMIMLCQAREELAAAGFTVDYFALVEADTLRETAELRGPWHDLRLVAAARLGSVRLLDTIALAG